MPSARSRHAFWNSRTRASVFGPKMPSTSRSGWTELPVKFSPAWRSLTDGPLDPRASVGRPIGSASGRGGRSGGTDARPTVHSEPTPPADTGRTLLLVRPLDDDQH